MVIKAIKKPLESLRFCSIISVYFHDLAKKSHSLGSRDYEHMDSMFIV